MGIKHSVIVPMYNVEQYLHKCINSLINQNLASDEYEIILVDDGSPDKCGEIADEYAMNHTNIKVIHQQNCGLSIARNAGIERAQGEYIQFVDSDDFLEPDVLKHLILEMERKELDVLRFGYQNVNESYEVYEPYKENYSIPYSDGKICDGITFMNKYFGYNCYACQFIIKRSLIRDNSIFFKPAIFFEDTEWTPRLLSVAQRVSSTNFMVYNYLSRPGSITFAISTEKKEKVLQNKLDLIDSLRTQSTTAVDNKWYRGMIAFTVLSVLTTVSIDFYHIKAKYIESLVGKNVFPLSLYHSPSRTKVKLMLINISPVLYCTLIHLKQTI